MSDLIHPTAIIADGAEIAADVKIGPYCVIGGDVRSVRVVAAQSCCY